eukprot:360291-Chlamydomonas_euryale.AAC.14
MVYAMKEIDLAGMSRKVRFASECRVGACKHRTRFASASPRTLICVGARRVHSRDTCTVVSGLRLHHQVLRLVPGEGRV